MTTLTKAQIPNEITTVEQLCAWTLEVLTFVNPEKTVIVAAGTADLVAQTGIQRFPQNAQQPVRFVGGCYLPRANDAGVRAVWMGCEEITPGQLPAQFRQPGT